MASLLAHEIGHVSGRHLTRQASRSELLRAGLAPVDGMTGITGALARQLGPLGLPLGVFHFSRAFEGEADLLGVQYLFAAGYDPRAAVDLLERLRRLSASAAARFPGCMKRTRPRPTGSIR